MSSSTLPRMQVSIPEALEMFGVPRDAAYKASEAGICACCGDPHKNRSPYDSWYFADAIAEAQQQILLCNRCYATLDVVATQHAESIYWHATQVLRNKYPISHLRSPISGFNLLSNGSTRRGVHIGIPPVTQAKFVEATTDLDIQTASNMSILDGRCPVCDGLHGQSTFGMKPNGKIIFCSECRDAFENINRWTIACIWQEIKRRAAPKRIY